MAVASDVPLLGAPGNFEELEQSFAALQVWLGSQTAQITAFGSTLSSVFQVPVGAIQAYGGPTAPSGWLLCNGAAVSRTTYGALFGVIGTFYGPGDGATTFNLPNLQQRFLLGKAASGTGAGLGDTGGTIDHTHSGGTTSSDGAHTHSGATGNASPGTDSQGSHDHGGATGSHSHGAGSLNLAAFQTSVTWAAGAGAAGYDNSVANAISGSTDSATASISSAGSHSHTVNSHNHSIGSDGGHTHSGGTTGANNPPFQVVQFIILAGV